MSKSQPSQYEEPFAGPSAIMFVMVGLPGAGKTTQARELAGEHGAVRLTPDHWMIPLFGDAMADGKRFTLEGRLISVALQALRLGTSVVLDFGLWGRDERSALNGWPIPLGLLARWCTCRWTETFSLSASRTARRRSRSRHSR